MPKHYILKEAIPEIIKILTAKGLDAVSCTELDSGYHITADNGHKKARIRVRHLQYDENYKDSPLPYSVYKIKAFPNGKHDNHTLRNVDFVVGYNPSEGSFACLPVHIFRSQGLACIHQKEGLRHEHYNSWTELDSFMTAKTNSVLEHKLTSREGYDPSTGSDYDFHRDVMEEDDSVERLTIMLEHGTVSDEDKNKLIERFRASYPQVAEWLNQRAIDKPNEEWSRRFDI
ncbi:hypothetical protein [Cohnella cellulosilytica]|uniref:Uncharacterized protein n=1 Tax=Cohnella cellulosilytica TaxID=986710 RepID=A0ABW2FE60_9BACL